MRKFTLIILLFLGSVSQAADNYYVATSGNDSYTSTQAQNPATPWHTIQKALNTITSNNYIINLAAGTYDYETAHSITLTSSKNGKTIVFQGADSDANLTIFSSSLTNALIFSSSLTSGNFTWRNMTIKSTYAGNRRIVITGNHDGSQLTFDNCILGVNGDTTTGYTQCIGYDYITASPPTRSVTLINSYCYGKDATSTLSLSDIGTLTISNTLVDMTNAASSGSYAAILVGYEVGTVTINDGSIIKSNSYGFTGGNNTSSFAECEIDNVTFDCNKQAIVIQDYLASGIFTNITGNNGIYLGHVYEYCYHPLGQIVIQDNNLIHTGAAGDFGLAIGYGVTGAEVSNNKVLNFNIAL